jgi:hypothetical protein
MKRDEIAISFELQGRLAMDELFLLYYYRINKQK